MKKNKHIHIVSNKIKILKNHHPLEWKKDKWIFINYLKEDLNIDDTCVENISFKKKNNLFRIKFDNYYYNIYIEHPDGGGKGSTAKKVSIPYNIPSFWNLIEKTENVLLINVYVPLDDQLNIDVEKRVYLIFKPSKIYLSKVFLEKTKNPSSRWVSLDEIFLLLNNNSQDFLENENIYC